MKRKKSLDQLSEVIDLFFEIGYLNKVMRSQRKNNSNSVAEHSFRVTMIGLILARYHEADVLKTLEMSLFHDLAESRTNDTDLVNKLYVKDVLEAKAIKDITEGINGLEEIPELFTEFITGDTLEAKIVRDADILEEIITEKEQLDRGDHRALSWLEYSIKEKIFELPLTKSIASKIMCSNSDNWWHKIIKSGADE